MSEAYVALIIFNVYCAATIDSKAWNLLFAAVWFAVYAVGKFKGA